MKKPRRFRLHPIAFLCLMAGLGGLGVGLMVLLSPYIPFGTWELAITPPSKAVRLIAYHYPQLFIQTEDNNIYACQELTLHWQSVNPSMEGDHSCIQVSKPHDAIYKAPWCNDPNPLTPLAPRNIIDKLDLRECAPDGYVDIHFIVLDDGRVLRWLNFQGGFGSETALLVEVGFGSIVGAITGIVLMLVAYLWKRVRKQ